MPIHSLFVSNEPTNTIQILEIPMIGKNARHHHPSGIGMAGFPKIITHAIQGLFQTFAIHFLFSFSIILQTVSVLSRKKISPISARLPSTITVSFIVRITHPIVSIICIPHLGDIIPSGIIGL